MALEKSGKLGELFSPTLLPPWFISVLYCLSITDLLFRAYLKLFTFYHAMHICANVHTAILPSYVVRSSVHTSVCDIGDLLSCRLGYFKNNYTGN